MSVPTLRWRAAINGMVETVSLPTWYYRGDVFEGAVWFEGLVFQESVGDPRARRYESHQDRATRRDAPADPDTCDHDDGDIEDDASYGLCQIMGYTARDLVQVPKRAGRWPTQGFSWLFRPLGNLALGLSLILENLQAVRAAAAPAVVPAAIQIERALARYNGGSSGDAMVDGDIRLRAYVDRVAARSTAVLLDRIKR